MQSVNISAKSFCKSLKRKSIYSHRYTTNSFNLTELLIFDSSPSWKCSWLAYSLHQISIVNNAHKFYSEYLNESWFAYSWWHLKPVQHNFSCILMCLAENLNCRHLSDVYTNLPNLVFLAQYLLGFGDFFKFFFVSVFINFWLRHYMIVVLCFHVWLEYMFVSDDSEVRNISIN